MKKKSDKSSKAAMAHREAETAVASGAERRDYFRVTERIPLWTAPCPVDENHPPEHYFPALVELAWFSELCALDDELARQLNNMETTQAAPLRLLQRQIGLLANRLQRDGPHAALEAISLSEGGLAFSVADAPAAGERLALAFTLPHSNRTLFCFGEVVRAQPTSGIGHGHEVAVVFSELTDTARQWIARQVLHAQRVQR